MSRLSRRQFVIGAAGAGLLAGCGRLPWQGPAPQAAKFARIGYLAFPAAPIDVSVREAALRQGLRERGWEEGQNYTLEWRLAGGDEERLAGIAAEYAARPVDVIVAGGNDAVLAAKSATNSIPIVMANATDPVETGLVDSLARPGGNVTGLSQLGLDLQAKRLELLKEAVPTVSHVVMPYYPGSYFPGAGRGVGRVAALRERLRALGVQVESLAAHDLSELQIALAAALERGADGLYVTIGFLTLSYIREIVELAATHRLPAVYDLGGWVEAGGLMSYGPSLTHLFHRAAYYVDRILRGAKPADLPIEQPMTFDFVVNLKTAQALGITFPNEIMLQVTEMIQ